jgi:hypothetical protein
MFLAKTPIARWRVNCGFLTATAPGSGNACGGPPRLRMIWLADPKTPFGGVAIAELIGLVSLCTRVLADAQLSAASWH